MTKVKGLTLTDVALTVEEGPVVYLHNGHDVRLQDVRLAFEDEAASGTAVRVEGPFTEQIRLQAVEVEKVEEILSTAPYIEAGAVRRD